MTRANRPIVSLDAQGLTQPCYDGMNLHPLNHSLMGALRLGVGADHGVFGLMIWILVSIMYLGHGQRYLHSGINILLNLRKSFLMRESNNNSVFFIPTERPLQKGDGIRILLLGDKAVYPLIMVHNEQDLAK